MARPLKKGIDFFSLDVDFFEDEKIEPISGEFGIKGEIIVIRLLCAVYRHGYFAVWNDQLKMTLAARCKVTSELIEQVVNRLVKWDFIDKGLFDSAKIITSRGIQKRFKEATRKRKYNYSILEYWLLDEQKAVFDAGNPRTAELFPPETLQSKVNESKQEKESKEERVVLLNGEQKIISVHLSPFFREMCTDQYHIERLCMNSGLRPDTLVDFIKQFFVLRSNENNTEIQTVKEAQTYFARWLLCELEKNKRQDEQQKKSTIGTGLNIVR